MKPFIFVLLTICCSGVFAQRNTGTPTSSIGMSSATSLTGGNDPFTYGQGIDLNNYMYSDVSGSPFLKQDYATAYIAFKNGRSYSSVPVKFDMLHNEIDIERNKTLLSLIGIDSLSYPDSIYQNMILKTGYPLINEHDGGSLYQIVAQNNKIQFLKYYHCHIGTIKAMGFPDKSSFDVDAQYYLFDKATRTIIPVKLNKKSFTSAMTEIGYSKSEIDKNNIDFKSEKDVAILIRSGSL